MKRKKTLKLVLINLIVLLFLLLATDAILATYFEFKPQQNPIAKNINSRFQLSPYKQYDWALDYWKDHMKVRAEYCSHMAWRCNTINSKTINVDTFGFRTTANLPPKEQTSSQIALLGGSTMWGYGVNDENTIPSHLAKYLDSTWVYNLGQNGYCAFQSYTLLQIELNKGLRPDLVISYDGANDSPVEKDFYQHLWRDRMAKKLSDIANPALGNHTIAFPGYRRLAKGLGLFSENLQLFTPHRHLGVTEKDNELAAFELLETWLSMKHLCERKGIKFICVLQPLMHIGNPDLSYFKGTRLEKAVEADDTYTEYYNNVISMLEQEEYAELKAYFLDLRFAFDNEQGMYLDFCHVFPKGNELIAQAMAKRIKSLNLSDKIKPTI